jgi:hypothetical protein
MSFVAFAATVGGGSALLGGALIGAGIGGAYSAVTGDGDVLNSMLTGGLIGGAGTGALGAMGVGAGGATSVGIGTGAGATGVAAPAAGSTFGALSAGAAPGAAAGSTLTSGLGVGSGSALAGTGSAAAGSSLIPNATSILGSTGIGNTAAGLTAKQMLGYGLAGSSALSLLGNQNRTSAGGNREEDEYTKRLKGYKLSSDYQPYRAQQPSSYYRPTYAADGGVMNSFDDEAGMDMAGGGMTSLGGYSDGGRMLKGPGDGMSDSIPGVIGGKQPARLADGEFVVPADVVSHLGNGSTDAGAKRLYSMMDDIRKARTGRKKQAPEINADKYLPINKKASGGIASIPGYARGGIVGYAEGGEIEQLYDKILGRKSDPEGLAAWQKALDTGTPLADIERMFKDSQEARTNTVKQIYNEQLGREAEPEGLANWLKVYNSGQTADQISKAIATAKEGQDMDIQSASSAYRKVLGRNPEPAGMQFWLSVAQNEGLTNKQLMDRIAEAAAPEMKARGITRPFTEMELETLGANPYAGYFSEKSIYDIAPDAKNVSMIGNRQVQFTTPVTQKAVVSQFIDGIYTAKEGIDMLNTPHAMANLNVALANGSLSTKDYDSLVNDLNSSKTPAEVRAALAKPKAQVIIDKAYGQQIAEATTLAEAKREAALRQAELTGIDPGYYLSNRTLTDAYKKAGVSIPFEYDFYKGVDTRDRESVMVTPENFLDKKNELVNAAKTNPYRATYEPKYDPIGTRTAVPASVRDPYSDEGLKILYGQMMDQYGAPAPGQVNPATLAPTPYTYKPPTPQRLLDEVKAKSDYEAKIAADRLAYDKAPITAENFDVNAYLKAYPEVGNPAVWQSTPYSHYLEANAKGDIRTGSKVPFNATPYTPAPLFGPGSSGTAAPAAPATNYFAAPNGQLFASEAAYNATVTPAKAGGLMAINRKKLAKTKPRKGLSAA